MATLTEVVAAVVVHSSAVAFSHFGVTLDGPAFERPAQAPAERIVARSPRKAQKISEKLSDCPEQRRAFVQKA
ncbi:hypothetical protein [Phenylobacterium sp.]|uniref:hypothetical protein n=1 Tax=Phenylobacterium sp. TaxID=1871053 RepID=UPI0028125DCD|nr:hypothetical protein [Phenylobacterium sp.]